MEKNNNLKKKIKVKEEMKKGQFVQCLAQCLRALSFVQRLAQCLRGFMLSFGFSSHSAVKQVFDITLSLDFDKRLCYYLLATIPSSSFGHVVKPVSTCSDTFMLSFLACSQLAATPSCYIFDM